MPTAYGYARCSHKLQIDRSTIDDQERRERAYYDLKLAGDGVEWGQIVRDEAVSAFKKRFYRRPGGQALLALLKPGDHIIFDKVDRVWRNVRDFAHLMDWFDKHQITVHILDLYGCSIQTGTSGGDMMLHMFVAGAQFEAQRIKERIRLTFAMQRARGTTPNPNPILGAKLIKKGKCKNYMVWCPQARGTMGEIVRLHDAEGMKWLDIRVRFNTKKVPLVYVHEKKEAPRRWEAKTFWTEHRLKILYQREKLYRRLGNPDPNMLYIAELKKKGSKSFVQPQAAP